MAIESIIMNQLDVRRGTLKDVVMWHAPASAEIRSTAMSREQSAYLNAYRIQNAGSIGAMQTRKGSDRYP